MSPFLRRHGFDVALVALLLVLQVVGFGQSPGEGIAVTLLSCAAILALLVRRVAAPVVALVYLAAVATSLAFDLPQLSSASIVLVLVVGAYSAGAYLPLPWAVATLGLWWAVVSLDYVAGREEGGPDDLLFGWMILACAFVPGVVARRLRGQADHARREAAEAKERESARAAEAAADERARVARELHDVVAHAVSIMVVQAAAAEEMLDRDPERARQALTAVQESGRSAVTELARMLDLLRGAPTESLASLPTLDGLPALVEEAGLAGVDVELETCPLPPLPAALQLCAFRVVQEAVTNAGKHARDPHVHVVVRADQRDLVVSVEDDGGSGPRAGTGTGHGLTGLRERVEVFGGRLETGPRPGGGFRLCAHLPLQGAA